MALVVYTHANFHILTSPDREFHNTSHINKATDTYSTNTYIVYS